MKKYELTDETKVFEGRTLFRIRALRDFGIVKSGDLGGWVESEHNLSHYGDCWIFNDGVVMDHGVVRGDGVVMDRGVVSDHGVVRDRGVVMDNAEVRGNAVVKDKAVVMGSAVVSNYAMVMDHGVVRDSAMVRDNAVVMSNADVRECQVLTKDAVFIDGIEYEVTIGDDFINVGCVSLTHGELLGMTKKKLPEFEGALEFWEQYGKALKSMVKAYRGEK